MQILDLVRGDFFLPFSFFFSVDVHATLNTLTVYVVCTVHYRHTYFFHRSVLSSFSFNRFFAVFGTYIVLRNSA